MAAKTYLQLVNMLARESGVSGSANAVSNVLGQTGMANRFVEWIRQSHTDIQNRYPNWSWLRREWSVDTIANQVEYPATACTDTALGTLIDRFGSWITTDEQGATNVLVYLTSGGVAGQRWPSQIPWSYYRGIYARGVQNPGPIIHLAVSPRFTLMVGPKPDGVYTLSGEYNRGAYTFVNNTDTPEFPERFHDLIAWYALKKYARHVAAGEALATAEVESKRLMRQLEADQLPTMNLAAPLA